MLAYTVTDLAKAVGTNQNVIYAAIRSGELKAFWIGQGKKGSKHILDADARAWISKYAERNRVQPNEIKQ